MNLDQWSADAETVFSESELESTIGNPVTLKTIFNDFFALHKENLKAWWEIKFLMSYAKHRIVPKGIRFKLSPSPRTKSPGVLEKWETELIESSLRLMNILLEEEKKLFFNKF